MPVQVVPSGGRRVSAPIIPRAPQQLAPLPDQGNDDAFMALLIQLLLEQRRSERDDSRMAEQINLKRELGERELGIAERGQDLQEQITALQESIGEQGRSQQGVRFTEEVPLSIARATGTSLLGRQSEEMAQEVARLGSQIQDAQEQGVVMMAPALAKLGRTRAFLESREFVRAGDVKRFQKMIRESLDDARSRLREGADGGLSSLSVRAGLNAVEQELASVEEIVNAQIGAEAIDVPSGENLLSTISKVRLSVRDSARKLPGPRLRDIERLMSEAQSSRVGELESSFQEALSGFAAEASQQSPEEAAARARQIFSAPIDVPPIPTLEQFGGEVGTRDIAGLLTVPTSMRPADISRIKPPDALAGRIAEIEQALAPEATMGPIDPNDSLLKELERLREEQERRREEGEAQRRRARDIARQIPLFSGPK